MSGARSPERSLLVLLGPTGTGKSAVALDLAAQLDGEIVGCDALQVYRGLNAATAKPSVDERSRVPHHLVDCVDPRNDFSMADYVRGAEQAIEAIRGRGRLPLVVGGTGLYLRGLLRGIIETAPRDTELRRRLYAVVDKGGVARLRRLLRRVDPESERRIPAADVQRLVRAIELAESPGPTWSERVRRQGTWAGGAERYRSLKIGLDTEAAELKQRLDARVDRFFESGLVDEVRELLEQGIPRQANAFKAIGYREVLGALDRGEDPDGVREEVKRNTRRYAKRQRTWFKSEPDVVWMEAFRERRDLLEAIVRRWNGTDRGD